MNEQPTAAKPAKTPRKTPLGIRRRHVRIGAGAAAGGLAIARVLGLHHLGDLPTIALPGQTQSPAPTGVDWVSPLDKPEAQVAHLMRRATFGATPSEYEQSIKDGFRNTVDRLLETKAAEPPALAGADDATQDKPIKPQELIGWWLDWMLRTPTPFAERMTFFWHGHFTSDFRKVNLQTPFIYWQNLTWRRMSLGNLHDMLYQVTIDPGMLRYLDLGTSTGKNPNENYSRELMELFTMGVGTFTEDDVRSGAKALSGWREPVTQAMYDALVKRAQEQGRPARRDVFMSPEFGAPASYRALVKSPTELMVHMAKALETPAVAKAIGLSGQGMGQLLFDPAEVGGWPSNASWISSNNVLERVNFAQATLTGIPKIPAFKDAQQVHLDGIVSPANAQLLKAIPDDTPPSTF